MSVIVVHDPRPTVSLGRLPDGCVFHDQVDELALKNNGVLYLPFENQYRYTRLGLGAGEPLKAFGQGSFPFVLDTGDGSCSWLYWTAQVVQETRGTGPTGFLTLMNDTARGQFHNIGLGITHPPRRLEDADRTQDGPGWILKGKLRLGTGGGAAAFAFGGSLSNALVQVVAATVTKHEYNF